MGPSCDFHNRVRSRVTLGFFVAHPATEDEWEPGVGHPDAWLVKILRGPTVTLRSGYIASSLALSADDSMRRTL